MEVVSISSVYINSMTYCFQIKQPFEIVNFAFVEIMYSNAIHVKFQLNLIDMKCLTALPIYKLFSKIFPNTKEAAQILLLMVTRTNRPNKKKKKTRREYELQ